MENNSNTNRREFLKTSGKAGLAAGLAFTVLPALAKKTPGGLFDFNADGTPFQQQPLGYQYNALEPVIDAMTMEIHYTKHAAAYAKNLADACTAEKVDTSSAKLEDLLMKYGLLG